MYKLDEEGFDFDNGYMFGFSFGAWLAIHTAKRFGEKKFQQIDGKKIYSKGLRSEKFIQIIFFFILIVCDPGL